MNTMHTAKLTLDASKGQPTTLGAEFDGLGTNFAIFSNHATRIELCIYDVDGEQEIARFDLPCMEGGIWYGYVENAYAGLTYGYRVHGPFAPELGHRFNPAKLLLDPYAREIKGELTWDDAVFGYPVGGSDLELDNRDSAPFMPKAVIVDQEFDWDADALIAQPWERTVIYEAHVKGITQLNSQAPEADRGTFDGLAHEAVINHLKNIGVTTIELLPIHYFLQDSYLAEKGLRNYWGYNTLGFFAPNTPYLKSGQSREVKEAVQRLHAAGIEVILDVVYNHTAEGNELGPTLSFRGIDNASYYLLAEDTRHCFDTTGCGNTLNIEHPMVLRMVLDSLRHWVQAYHIDGFRFDLASTLGREASGFEREGAFFAAINQDPVLSKVKLIAEPWDIGDGGYQVGGFPWPFREWNDKFRDDTRAFWRKDDGTLPLLSQRVLGSPTQFSHSLRPATTSINFISAHDGFTLWDTVSYSEKHNEANGENNADGHDHNLSDNLGCEGATEDEATNTARLRRAKGMLATLMLSQGVPMLLAGDEMGQSQQGNNNAYAQDNELSWINWQDPQQELIDAVANLAKIRTELNLASPHFAGCGGSAEVVWWHIEGREMEPADWDYPHAGILALQTKRDESTVVFMVFNRADDIECVLPPGRWKRVIDTAQQDIRSDNTVYEGSVSIGWQSVSVFTQE